MQITPGVLAARLLTIVAGCLGTVRAADAPTAPVGIRRLADSVGSPPFLPDRTLPG
jgi:hypothetical protein